MGSRPLASRPSLATFSIVLLVVLRGSAASAGEPAAPPPDDCNENGILDLVDIDPRLDVPRPLAIDGFEYPQWLVVTDIDRDGRTDLVCGDREAAEIVLLHNEGERRWSRSTSLGEFRAFHLAAVDLPGSDGPTIIAASLTSEIVVLSSTGDGALSLTDRVGLAGTVTDMTAADLDGDGAVDAIVSSRRPDTTVILWGGPGGTITELELLNSGNLGSLWVVDMDEDGDLDLVTSNGGVLTLEQVSPREFVPGEPHLTCGDLLGAPTDFDADGTPDLVLADPDLTLALSSRAHRSESVDGFPYLDPRGAIITDLDDDGAPELVVTSREDGVSILRRTGRSAFEASHYAFASGPELVVHDLDGDGLTDLATAAPGTLSVRIAWGIAPGEFDLPRQAPVGGGPLTAADFDGDGNTDIATLSGRSFMLHTATGFATYRSREIFALTNPSAVVAADFDGDGDGDVICSDGADILLLRGSPSGLGPVELVSRNDSLDARDILAADLDGDGDLDIAMYSGFARVLWLGINRGDARFEISDVTTELDIIHTLTTGDLDGDGQDEILVARGNRLSIVRFDGEVSVTDDEVLISTVDDAAMGDVDGDGRTDVALSEGGFVRLLLGNGSGGFEDPLSIGTSDHIRGLLLEDLDRDGADEVIACRWNSRGLGIIRRVSRDEYDDTLDLADVPRANELAAGKTADGSSHVIAWRSPDRMVTLVANRTLPASADENGNAVPDECETELRVPGDCTGDGRVDIADALCVAGTLFLGSPRRFPCGDGTLHDPLAIRPLDWQGDGRVDLADAIGVVQHLFLGGGPHVLWTDGEPACRLFFGCPATDTCP